MTAEAKRSYSLIGPAAELAREQGLVAAEWYHTDVQRKRMKELMQRRDGPAIRDAVIWFALLVATGFGGAWYWGSWVCVPFFICYGVLYSSAAGARWHETGHGTAFKTSWLNDVLYQISSFMIMYEPTFWRWSHVRHHTDTIIVGRDREIMAMRPPDLVRLALGVVRLPELITVAVSVARHTAGRLTAEEATFIPEAERWRVYREARVWVVIYAGVIATAISLGSWLPLMLVGLPSIYGAWLEYLFAVTQHTGLAENVLDHRLNSRTIYMNRALRFLFWNMNYHVEHHMFPMVPYHALPALHAEVRDDMPTPYKSMTAAYREIIPTLARQLRHRGYFVERKLPASARPFRSELHQAVFRT